MSEKNYVFAAVKEKLKSREKIRISRGESDWPETTYYHWNSSKTTLDYWDKDTEEEGNYRRRK